MGKIKIPPPPVNVTIVDVTGDRYPAVVKWDGYDPADPERALWTASPADEGAFIIVDHIEIEKKPPTKFAIRTQIEGNISDEPGNQ